MKCLIFFTLIAACFSLPYYRYGGEKTFKFNEDGTMIISSMNGRRLIISCPSDSKYFNIFLRNFARVPLGDKCNKEEVILKQDLIEDEVERKASKTQCEILQDLFQKYEGTVNVETYEEFLRKIYQCIEMGTLDLAVYDTLTCMREQWELEQKEDNPRPIETLKKALWERWLKSYLNRRQQEQMYPESRTHPSTYQQPLEEQHQKQKFYLPERSPTEMMWYMMLQNYLKKRTPEQTKFGTYDFEYQQPWTQQYYQLTEPNEVQGEEQQFDQRKIFPLQWRNYYCQPQECVREHKYDVPNQEYIQYLKQKQLLQPLQYREQYTNVRDNLQQTYPVTTIMERRRLTLEPKYQQEFEGPNKQWFQTDYQKYMPEYYRSYRQQPFQLGLTHENQPEKRQFFPKTEYNWQEETQRIPMWQQIQQKEHFPQETAQVVDQNLYQPRYQQFHLQYWQPQEWQQQMTTRCPWIRYQLYKMFGNARPTTLREYWY